ncbi:MAG: M20/M25/M40 family metallo-hydrolase, partial [Gluconacetobacter diazotrophicus]|nr:M20/M25/M40 family metallo-hydrolase [Gluconacetobacter diazotrophicus]
NARRQAAVDKLRRRAEAVAAKRGCALRWTTMQEAGSVACDPGLSALLREAVRRHEPAAPSLPSGAGHDAAALAAICPTAMMFVRCKGGVSHHPAESINTADVTKAIAALRDFVLALAASHPFR